MLSCSKGKIEVEFDPDLGTPTIPVIPTADITVSDYSVVEQPNNNQKTFELKYDSASNSQATSCSVNNLQGGVTVVGGGCSCTLGVCTVTLQGNGSPAGPAGFDYTVTNSHETSESATVSYNLRIPNSFYFRVQGSPGIPFVLQTVDNYNYNATIDWGDGNIENYIHSGPGAPALSHTYSGPISYYVTITGTFEALGMNYDSDSRENLLQVATLGDVGWKSLAGAFMSHPNLTDVGLGDLSGVTNMDSMFKDSPQVSPTMNNWDLSSVTNISEMFHGTPSADPDLTKFDFTKITSMTDVINISGISTANLTSFLNKLADADTGSSLNNVTLNNTNTGYLYSASAASSVATLTGRGWSIAASQAP